MSFDREISFRTLAVGAALAASIVERFPSAAAHEKIIAVAIGALIGWAYDRLAFKVKGGASEG